MPGVPGVAGERSGKLYDYKARTMNAGPPFRPFSISRTRTWGIRVGVAVRGHP